MVKLWRKTEFIGNCSKTYYNEQLIKAIEKFTNICKNLWGIRNNKTNKFIYIGMLDNKLLFCDSEKTEKCNINAKRRKYKICLQYYA